MLRIADADWVRLMTLDRPDVRNALDSATYNALGEALAAAATDDEVAVVVLTGAGASFCAGQDVSEMRSMGGRGGAEAAQAAWEAVDRFLSALEEFPKPLIAAVNGVATGIGATLLGSCDLVLAADTARFRLPFVDLGLVPEAGSTNSFPRLMGSQASAYAFFTGEWFDERERRSSGWCGRYTRPTASRRGDAFATLIAAKPMVSLIETKRLMLAGRVEAIRAARRREEPVFSRLLGGPANREALAAFAREAPARIPGRRALNRIASGSDGTEPRGERAARPATLPRRDMTVRQVDADRLAIKADTQGGYRAHGGRGPPRRDRRSTRRRSRHPCRRRARRSNRRSPRRGVGVCGPAGLADTRGGWAAPAGSGTDERRWWPRRWGSILVTAPVAVGPVIAARRSAGSRGRVTRDVGPDRGRRARARVAARLISVARHHVGHDPVRCGERRGRRGADGDRVSVRGVGERVPFADLTRVVARIDDVELLTDPMVLSSPTGRRWTTFALIVVSADRLGVMQAYARPRA